MELEPDMVTIRTEPKVLFPIKEKPGAFPDHAFFEASSIRKVDGKYCFVYSSEHNHDLCYAMSDRPDGPYTYGGVLVDLGDLYLHGNTDEHHANNYLGNTHGGLLNIGDTWYIFYHRQTNRTSYARQACAEKLERTADGGFRQAEVTSCGLNPGPLLGKGRYEARIACNLWAKGHETGRVDGSKKALAAHPYFTQTGRDRESDGDQYIANMRDCACAGFKYFLFDGTESRLIVSYSGKATGRLLVSDRPDGSNLLASLPVSSSGPIAHSEGDFTVSAGTRALYFTFSGSGELNFHAYKIS